MEHPDQRFLLMDWGFNTQMLLLSRGSINKEEIFGRFMTEDVNDTTLKELYERATQPHTVFVFHASPYVVHKKPQEVFDRMLERFGPQKEIIKVFLHKRGDPVYVLVKVRAT